MFLHYNLFSLSCKIIDVLGELTTWGACLTDDRVFRLNVSIKQTGRIKNLCQNLIANLQTNKAIELITVLASYSCGYFPCFL